MMAAPASWQIADMVLLMQMSAVIICLLFVRLWKTPSKRAAASYLHKPLSFGLMTDAPIESGTKGLERMNPRLTTLVQTKRTAEPARSKSWRPVHRPACIGVSFKA